MRVIHGLSKLTYEHGDIIAAIGKQFDPLAITPYVGSLSGKRRDTDCMNILRYAFSFAYETSAVESTASSEKTDKRMSIINQRRG